jgi:hypothetical protein
MGRILFLLIFCGGFFSIYGSEKYIVQPPKGWECITDPAQLPKKIKEIYVGKANHDSRFTPSINVSHEETLLPPDQYFLVAKSYHEGEAGTRCTVLGNLMTTAGQAKLLQIDRASQWGPVRFVQAILLQDGEAYVITATCLKKDYSALSAQVFKAIQSFSLPVKNIAQ